MMVLTSTRASLRGATRWHADVAELVDALDLGSSGAIRGGSIPLIRTSTFLGTHVLVTTRGDTAATQAFAPGALRYRLRKLKWAWILNRP